MLQVFTTAMLNNLVMRNECHVYNFGWFLKSSVVLFHDTVISGGVCMLAHWFHPADTVPMPNQFTYDEGAVFGIFPVHRQWRRRRGVLGLGCRRF